MGSRSPMIVLDQAASSASNASTVLIAAIILTAEGFAAFASVQLVGLTLVGLGRLGLYIPALASQRDGISRQIPLAWAYWVSVGLLLLQAPTTLALAWHFQLDRSTILILLTAPIFVFLQDGLRYVRLSQNRPRKVLLSDLVWLAVTPLLLLTGPSSVAFAAFAWAVGAFFAAVALIEFGGLAADLPTVRFVVAWRVGRWGALEATTAGAIIAIPTLLTAFGSSPLLIEMYRVLQAILSPLNVLTNSILLVFGLTAATLGEAGARGWAALRVRRVTVVMVALATTLAVSAWPIALLVTDVAPSQLLLPWLLVSLAALAGSWSAGRIAVGHAMGMQKHLFAIRAASLMWLCAMLVLMWNGYANDPIGPTLLGSALVTCVGSSVIYTRGRRTLHA